jgi:hypothetical protein
MTHPAAMSSEKEERLNDALRSLQSKHAYFLLAAAGASIGFAVTRTESLEISWSQLPLLVALVCWGVSFYFGCRQVERVQDGLAKRVGLLELIRSVEMLGRDEIEELEKIADEYSDRCADDALRYRQNQFRLLVLGACSYIAWRILEMSLQALS